MLSGSLKKAKTKKFYGKYSCIGAEAMTSGESYVMDDIVVAAEDSEVANIEHGEFELAVGGGYN